LTLFIVNTLFFKVVIAWICADFLLV
jgi:hypothetical protein